MPRGIDILWSYRQHINGDKPDVFTRDSGAIYRHLAAIEGAVPGRVPLAAHDDIAASIRAGFAHQATELADRFGVRLDAASASDSASPRRILQPGDVFVINADRRERLAAELLKRLLTSEPLSA